MRVLGAVLVGFAVLGLFAVALACGYQNYLPRWRQQLRTLDWRTYQNPSRLKYFDEHSPTPIVFSLICVAAIGFVLKHYG